MCDAERQRADAGGREQRDPVGAAPALGPTQKRNDPEKLGGLDLASEAPAI
jgi:hypothetical protein